MNNKIVICFSFLLIASSLLFCAPRPATYRDGEKTEDQASGQQQVIMIPVSLSQQPALTLEEQRDRDFFNKLLSIATSFGNILLNTENNTIVIQNVGNMLNGIVQAAEIITKYQTRGVTSDELIVMLARALVDQAKSQVHVSH